MPHSSPSSAALEALQLPRVPLVPDTLLRRHDAYVEVDTRFRRAARLLQCLWLADNQIETGMHTQQRDDGTMDMKLSSLLSPSAAAAGANFISPEVHRLVRHSLAMREEGALYDEQRLFANGLASGPLLFNVFGPLALDLNLATAVFRQLLPTFVSRVTRLDFESAPGRHDRRYLHDATAFDLAVRVVTPEDEDATIFVEMKYSESALGPAARWRTRYDEASRECGLYRDAEAKELRSPALEQFWREHMLAQLAVDNGATPKALFVAIGPALNRRVQAAFRAYEGMLAKSPDRVGFQAITLEAIIQTIADAGESDIAQTLWRRYCDFSRIYKAILAEYETQTIAPIMLEDILEIEQDVSSATKRLVRGSRRRPRRNSDDQSRDASN